MPLLFSSSTSLYFIQERTEPYFSMLLASVLDSIHPVSPIIKKEKKKEWGTLELLQLLSRARAWTKKTRLTRKGKGGKSLWCRPQSCSGARPNCEVIQSDREKCKSFGQLTLMLAHYAVFDAVVICRTWLQFPRLSDPASKSSTTNMHVISSNLASTFMGNADLGNLRLRETVSASEPQPRDNTGYKFNLWLRAGVSNTRLLDPLQLKVFFCLESSCLSSGLEFHLQHIRLNCKSNAQWE